MRIPYADIKDYVPAAVGEQVAINHTECPAGQDTRRRLFIKNSGDAVMAYCHNCSGHLVRKRHRGVRSAEVVQALLAQASAVEATATEVQLPPDMQLNPTLWPDAARAWVYGCNLDDKDIQDYSLGYSPSWGRVILPVYEGGKCIFWQGRLIEGTGQKYISVKSAKKPLFVGIPDPVKEQDRGRWNGTFIVEDMMSALRLTKYGWHSLALLGTSEPDDILARMPKGPNCVVWLDDDVPGRRRATVLGNRLKLLSGGTVWRVKAGTLQPKQMSDDEINHVNFEHD